MFNHKINGILEEIKMTEEMIKLHREGGDPADRIMETQFFIRRIKLMRELLAEFAVSGLNIKKTKGIMQRLTEYIERTEEAIGGKKENKDEFKEIEKLMAV
jgi:hypothetical protein